jgi:Flp pilus assembly protein CpaB
VPPSTRALRPATTNGDTPAPQPPPPLTANQRLMGRNRARIAGGILLMASSALVAMLLFATLGDRQTVLSVVGPVLAGEVIEPGDLGEALVAADTPAGVVPAERRDEIVGRTAAVDLVAGSLLADPQVGEPSLANSGEPVVGAVLAPGAFPLGLGRGDRVIAVTVPAEAAEAAPSGRAVPSVPATIIAIEEQPDSGGGVAVSLAVPPDDAAALSLAGAQGRMTLVLAPR